MYTCVHALIVCACMYASCLSVKVSLHVCEKDRETGRDKEKIERER